MMSFIKFIMIMVFLMGKMPETATFDEYFNRLYEVVEEVNHDTEKIDNAMEQVERYPFGEY